MTKTNNYQLPQWEAGDPVRREDFNGAMAAIDAGVAAAQGAAEAAQSTADSAQSAADAVQDAYTPSNQPYVAGRYTGTGEETTITLGFRPKFLVVAGMRSTSAGNSTSEWDRSFGMCDGVTLSGRLAFTNTGFIARAQGYPYDHYPNFTEDGRVCSYIAFR